VSIGCGEGRGGGRCVIEIAVKDLFELKGNVQATLSSYPGISLRYQ